MQTFQHCSVAPIVKKIFVIGLLMVAGCSDAKQQVAIPKVEKKLNTQHQIKVDGCQISYNNKPIDFNAPLTDWLKVFGSKYRKKNYMEYIYEGKVETPKEYYIYDDAGIRLIYDVNNKKMEHVGLWVGQSKWNKDFAWETEDQYQTRMENPDSFQAKQNFKDGIQVEDVIVGAYPMDQELRSISRHRRGTSYYIWAKCKNGQAGESFDINLSTSYDNDPEVIDGISFYKMRTTDVPEDIALKQRYENCKNTPEDEVLYGKYCADIRKQYQEKFGKEQVEQ
ncbi:DUF7738 domain-containing protein [Acinetobacter haemolyticus]|uniref:DUF7738 domain-containing protein n=1 Tax=Acinetobacter haemolyticus TaxID=29430 RepID=UPI002DB7ACAA|nr:hypothetical protein [Acinetobacter haemolyticus]MEB6676507.1 hypothetical protein [Acinetobacter haemolyticus]